jgi:fibronectin-binding autotransporter adhesin
MGWRNSLRVRAHRGLGLGGAKRAMKLMSAIAPMTLGGVVLADTVTYTPPGSSGAITSVDSGNWTGTALAAGAGITPTSNANTLSAIGFDGATGSNAALTANNFFTFSVVPAANYSMSFTGLTATVSRDTATPAPDRARFFYSVDNFATGLGTGNTNVGTAGTAMNVTLTNVGVTSAVEFRLPAWSSGTGTTTSSFFAIGPTNPVVLTGTTLLRGAGALTWDGGRGTGTWSTYSGAASNQTNWNLNNTPVAALADDLVFAGTTQRNTTNDISGVTANSVTFSNTAGAFTLNGIAISLNGGVVSNSTSLQTINLDVTLNGASTWNAAAGILRVNGNVINGSNLLTVDGGFDSTFSGVIGAGSGGLQKNGLGTLNLTGNNTYSGDVAINSGTVNVKAIDTTPTNAQGLGVSTNAIGLGGATAATLVYTGTGNATLNRGINIGAGGATIRTTAAKLTLGTAGVSSGVNGNGAGVTLDSSGGEIVVNSVISGTGTSITKTGSNVLTLTGANTFDGALVVNAGTLSFNSLTNLQTSPQPLGAGTGAITVGSAGSAATLTYTSGSTRTLNRGILVGGAGGAVLRATNGPLTFGTGGVTSGIDAAGNALTIDTAPANVTVDSVIGGVGSSVTKIGSATLTLKGANTFDGALTVNEGILSLNLVNANVATPQSVGVGASAITLGTATTAATFMYTGSSGSMGRDLAVGGAAGAMLESTSSKLTFTGNISAGANPLVFGGAERIISTGIVSGSGSVTKQDTGTLTLSGANTFNGALAVNAGVLIVSTMDPVPTNPQALGTLDGPITVGSATAAAFAYTGGANTMNRQITVGGAGGATITATGGNFTLGTAGATSGISAGANPLTLVPNGANIVVNSVISGTGSVTKAGPDSLTVAGANTFTGALTVNEGTLNVALIDVVAANPQPLGVGVGAISVGSATPATLTYTGSTGTTLSRDIVVGGAGGATLRTTSDKLTFAGNISAGANPLTFSSGDRLIVNGTVSGSGSITKIGSDQLTLSGPNTFTGAIAVDDGTLNISSIDSVVTNPQPLGLGTGAITVGSGTAGTLAYTSGANRTLTRAITVGGAGGATIRVSSASAALTLSQAIAGNGNPLTLDSSGTMNVTGSISGTGTSVTKITTGLLVLAGANTYSGNTVLNAGVTSVSSAGNLGDESATNNLVFGGGTLKTTAAVASARSATVNAGGGTFDSNGFDSSLKTVSGAGDFTKSGAGNLTVWTMSANNLVVGDVAGNHLTIAPRSVTGQKAIVRVNGLTVGAAAALDLNDNDLVVGGGSFSTLQGQVLSGYSGSLDTTKTGIVSTTSQTIDGGTTILALFDNSLAGFTDYPTGSGFTIAANAIVGKYTYIGDTNYDGQVTPQDYTATDSNLGTSVDPAISWFYGDTNFDGNIDATDYAGIDGALGLGQGNPLAAQGLAAVPEPAFGLTAMGAGFLLMRRRVKK